MSHDPATEIVRLPVSVNLKDQRVDVGLVIAGLIASRAQSQKLIDDGKVKVGGRAVKASYRLQVGDTIEVTIEKKPDLELVPYYIDLDVVFEDGHVIVINKPAGLVVHPACGHTEDTLVNALVAYNTKLSEGSEKFRPGLVHRLDKDTSGLIVLAKDENAHNSLARQFLNKTIHRRYWAVCFGSFREKSGTVSTFIGRDPGNRKRFYANQLGQGKEAVTHYKVLAESKGLSLVELRLETGRTHQIRVHLSSLNHPIVGDDLYNGKKRARNLSNQDLKKLIVEMPRFALHAKELGFVHPQSHEQIKFNSDIPEDLHTLFNLAGLPLYVE